MRPRLRRDVTFSCQVAIGSSPFFGHLEQRFRHVILRPKASRQRAFLSNLPLDFFLWKFWKHRSRPRSFVKASKFLRTAPCQPVFWLPAEGLHDKARADRIPYDLWASR
jgi:hypothetical protein